MVSARGGPRGLMFQHAIGPMAVFDTPSTGQDNLQLPLSRTEELRQRVITIQGFAVTGRDGHGGVERRVDCSRGHPERSIGVSCQHPIAC